MSSWRHSLKLETTRMSVTMSKRLILSDYEWTSRWVPCYKERLRAVAPIPVAAATTIGKIQTAIDDACGVGMTELELPQSVRSTWMGKALLFRW